VPQRGVIGIHNRSHYEPVTVERVKNLAPKKVWSKRYDHINNFERMLADEGVTILKFFLHISKDEQKRRLERRLSDPHKSWKFDIGDLEERALWDDYQLAFDDMLEKCSTEYAPWYVVPSDRKWFRNYVLAETIVHTMETLDMKYPAPQPNLDKVVVK
jgi:polyphosphate kinase 2 (PPK2 family)